MAEEVRKPRVPSSSPVTFLPRPIMLGAKANRSVTDRERKQSNGSLLRSIARFLEANGFLRTLAVLHSEVRTELKGSIGNSFDLEEMLAKFLDSSQSSYEYNIGGHKVQDGRISSDIREARFLNKKSKERDGQEAKGKNATEANDNVRTEQNVSKESKQGRSIKTWESGKASLIQRKGKKKKKKLYVVFSQGNAGAASIQGGKEIIDHGNFFDVSPVKSKSNKKKACVTCAPSEENTKQVNPENLHEFVEEKLNSLKSLSHNDIPELDRLVTECKDQKNWKTNLDCYSATSNVVGLESPYVISKETSTVLEANMDVQKPERSAEDSQKMSDLHHMKIISTDKKRKKKSGSLHTEATRKSHGRIYGNGDNRNYLIEEYNNSMDKTYPNLRSDEDDESSKPKNKKKRKLCTLMESKIDKKLPSHQSERRNSGSMGDYKDCLESINGDEKIINKKRKTGKNQEISCKSSYVLPDVLIKYKEDASDCNGQNDLRAHEQTNAVHSKNDMNGTPLSKASKTDRKLLAESKAVKSFQKVKIDGVKFTYERLQDNRHWPKDEASNGYGAKTQEILGQVRGRDFRHHKTKKKRGATERS